MQKTAAHAETRDEVAEMVAGNLSYHMERERWTGRSFAIALGLKPIYVQRRMSGEVEMSATDLKVFSDKLGIRVQDLFKPRPVGGGTRLVDITPIRDLKLRTSDYSSADAVIHDLATYRQSQKAV